MATSNPAATTDVDELRRIATEAIQALALASSGQARPKRPELPAFDKGNIEIWIKRVEAAYERAGVSTAKERFAFLESKFDVSTNPKINTFLYGPATDTAWNDFLTYLRSEYGETRRQEANFLLQPIQRNGLRPSQLLAKVVERSQKATIDDIRKEKVISALPSEVQRAIIDKVEGLSADQTAELADKFFDKEGKLLHSSASSSIHNVESFANATEENDGPEGINAIPANRNQRRPDRQFQSRKPGPSTSRRYPPKVSAKPLCWRHDKFGKDATSCEPGCSLYPKNPAKENAGRRA